MTYVEADKSDYLPEFSIKIQFQLVSNMLKTFGNVNVFSLPENGQFSQHRPQARAARKFLQHSTQFSYGFLEKKALRARSAEIFSIYRLCFLIVDFLREGRAQRDIFSMYNSFYRIILKNRNAYVPQKT